MTSEFAPLHQTTLSSTAELEHIDGQLTHAQDHIQPSATSEAQQLETAQDPVEHMWDDVVLAIREDLRAFWGLWETDIAPRLDPGVPVTYDDARTWKVDNIDVDRVYSRLQGLTRQVKGITDAYAPKTSIEERVLYCVKSLFPYLDRVQEDKINLQLFVELVVVTIPIPDLVYPRPVN